MICVGRVLRSTGHVYPSHHERQSVVRAATTQYTICDYQECTDSRIDLVYTQAHVPRSSVVAATGQEYNGFVDQGLHRKTWELKRRVYFRASGAGP